MINLNRLVDNCLIMTIIHPSVLKQIDYKTATGKKNEWKTAAGVMLTDELKNQESEIRVIFIKADVAGGVLEMCSRPVSKYAHVLML